MFQHKKDLWQSDTWSPFASRSQVGGKARNLYRLKRAGHNVPRWLVVGPSSQRPVSVLPLAEALTIFPVPLA